MPSIAIRTSQNVTIMVEGAPIHLRMVAYLIDIVGVMIGSTLIVAFGIGQLHDWGIVSDSVLKVILITYSVAMLLYPLLAEAFLNGRTAGKAVFRLRVVRLDGRQPSVYEYVIRWLIGLVEWMPPLTAISLVVALFSRYGQRVGDMVAGTVVIQQTKIPALDVLVSAAAAKATAPAVLPTIGRLTPEDIVVVVELRAAVQHRRYDTATLVTMMATARERLEYVLDMRIPEEDDSEALALVLREYDAEYGNLPTNDSASQR